MNARLKLVQQTPAHRCAADHVLNPYTNHCIRIGSHTYQDVVSTMEKPVQGHAFYYIPGATVQQQPPDTVDEVARLRSELLDYQIRSGGKTFQAKVREHRIHKPLTNAERNVLKNINRTKRRSELTDQQKNILDRHEYQSKRLTLQVDKNAWQKPWAIFQKNPRNKAFENLYDMSEKLAGNYERVQRTLESEKRACIEATRAKDKRIKELEIELDVRKHELERHKAIASPRYPWVKELETQDETIKTLRNKIKALHEEINTTQPRRASTGAGAAENAHSIGAISYNIVKRLNRNKTSLTSTEKQHYFDQIDRLTNVTNTQKLEAKTLFDRYASFVNALQRELQTKNEMIQKLKQDRN